MNTTTITSTSTADSSSSSQPATSTVAPVTTNISSVHFKVRCERLGHGEDVYLVPLEENEDAAMNSAAISQLLLKPPSPTNRHKVRYLHIMCLCLGCLCLCLCLCFGI
jgi:hypothetical protein